MDKLDYAFAIFLNVYYGFPTFFVYLKNHDCGVLLTIIFKNLILYSRRKQKHKFS